jgi:prophage regulatory protein
MKSVNRVITMRDLYDYVALRRTQIEKLVAEGRFPKPIKISDRRKAWLESEVQAWLAERIAARDNAAWGATMAKVDTADSAVLVAALEYAGWGLPVFPCGDNKAPLTEHGFKDATTDPKQIREWWGKCRSPSRTRHCRLSRNPIPTLTASLSLKGFLPRCQTAARGPPRFCGAPGSKTDNARSTLGETAKILKPASFQELPLKDRIDEDRSSPLLSEVPR